MLREIINSHDKNSIALLVDEDVYYTWGQITSLLQNLDNKLAFIEEGSTVQIGANPCLENILAISSACFSGWSFETVDGAPNSKLQTQLNSLVLKHLDDPMLGDLHIGNDNKDRNWNLNY